MRRWAFSTAIWIAVFACGFEGPAQTIVSKVYVLDRKNSDDVFSVIDNATHSPFDIAWPDLRRRLYKSSLPSDFLRISTVSGRVSVSDETPRPIIDVMAGGAPMEWKINDGQILDVSAKATDEAVLMTYRGSDYERTTTYRNVGQSLIEDTTIASPRIATPIHYKLVYK